MAKFTLYVVRHGQTYFNILINYKAGVTLHLRKGLMGLSKLASDWLILILKLPIVVICHVLVKPCQLLMIKQSF